MGSSPSSNSSFASSSGICLYSVFSFHTEMGKLHELGVVLQQLLELGRLEVLQRIVLEVEDEPRPRPHGSEESSKMVYELDAST